MRKRIRIDFSKMPRLLAVIAAAASLNRSDGSVNCTSSDAFCGLGRAPTFSDNLVQVFRVN